MSSYCESREEPEEGGVFVWGQPVLCLSKHVDHKTCSSPRLTLSLVWFNNLEDATVTKAAALVLS